MKSLKFTLLFLLASSAALAQGVQQSGTVTPGHVALWKTTGVIGDAGTAANPFASSFGIIGGPICVNSGPITGPYNAFCLQASSLGGTLSLFNHGGATGGFTINVNGVNQALPVVPLPTTTNDPACFSNTTGSLKDCGFAFTGFANPTASVGLSAVNGSATTALRSDAAPPLSSSIQSALTGTNNYLLNGTGSFGFSAEQYCTLTQGCLGGSQAAATANEIPVYPGSGGAAVPTYLNLYIDPSSGGLIFDGSTYYPSFRGSVGNIAAAIEPLTNSLNNVIFFGSGTGPGGVGTAITSRRQNGTDVSPTATLNGDELFFLQVLCLRRYQF